MPDKEIIQAVLDAVGVSRGAARQNGGKCHEEGECGAPDNVLYVILCNCVAINNGACEDWEFCNSNRPC